VPSYIKCCIDLSLNKWRPAVTEMGGHVAKKLGDGLMSLFGYPVAQENDAERAARTARAIQRARTRARV
jgi:class 3 adenylate cyclase